MKVLLVNAGPHAQGNTFTALNEVAKRLQENGVEAEIVEGRTGRFIHAFDAELDAIM